jgi:hypothetical protein
MRDDVIVVGCYRKLICFLCHHLVALHDQAAGQVVVEVVVVLG